MNKWERERQMVKMYKERYPEGTRIEVEFMGEDPRPIASGTRGTVRVVDDMGTVHCDFDNGRRLGLVPGEDSFRKLTEREIFEEKRDALVASFAVGQEFYEKETGKFFTLKYADPGDIWSFDVFNAEKERLYLGSCFAARLATDILNGEIIPASEVQTGLDEVIQACEGEKRDSVTRFDERPMKNQEER